MTLSHSHKNLPSMIPLHLEERHGIDRHHEPVSIGIPFPKGMIWTSSDVFLLDPDEREIPLQAQELSRWPDSSLKWILFDFQATLSAHTTVQYTLNQKEKNVSSSKIEPPENTDAIDGITLQRTTDSFLVHTGAATFVLDTQNFKPFQQVLIDGRDVLDSSGSDMELLDESGQKHKHIIHRLFVETEGLLRTTLKIEGTLSCDEAPNVAEFFARMHFYAQSALVRIDYTIRNPRAAKHPGGVWDLGDEGSIYFQDLSLALSLNSTESPTLEWTNDPQMPFQRSQVESIEIYQDSSGGENWNCSNHVNRSGNVMHRFCGYRATAGDTVLEEGKRVTPIVSLGDSQRKITGTIRDFWQNFPKALEVTTNRLTFRLFPAQYQDSFELQGGEQKTHTLFVDFETFHLEEEDEAAHASLRWVHEPLRPSVPADWYAQSKVLNYFTSSFERDYPEVVSLIDTAIEGEQTFFDRREIIDEYGWRNFGELYADHEQIFYKGDGIAISHYNNQYDCIYGMFLQYARSGDCRWFDLLDDLAHHVIDIDIYHTDQDKVNFSGGLFWHTDHYRDAATSTHRGFSKATMLKEGLSYYGGGPGNEHNYTTGLLYHYYLTGEFASKEAVLGLADWVIDMDDGTKTKFRFLNRRPTGYASTSDIPEYHGPGRGAAYSLHALLDAYLLSENVKYLAKIDELIQRCIHPEDRIEEHDLKNTEDRWFYIVFLQVIGRYLDFKRERDEYDYMYCYAQKSLLHYATWMGAHEVPFSSLFETLEYPTETWPAQDLRKSVVFTFAAKLSQEPLRSEYLEKAEFFFEKPLQDLFSFETKTLTRPLVLLMNNSMMHAYWQHHRDEIVLDVQENFDFGPPRKFKPQLYSIYKLRTTLFTIRERIKGLLGR